MAERNVVAWTAMIKSYVDNYQIYEAFKLFLEMPQRNLYSWNTMISGCLNAERVDYGIQLFNLMPQNSKGSDFLDNYVYRFGKKCNDKTCP